MAGCTHHRSERIVLPNRRRITGSSASAIADTLFKLSGSHPAADGKDATGAGEGEARRGRDVLKTTIRRARRWPGVLVGLLIPPTSACAPQRAAESLLLGGHFELIQGLPYGSDPRQRLDVYRPRDAPTAASVIVFLYGGRWQHGSRKEYRLLGDAITRRGLVAVVPDYRLYPAVRFPTWVEDAARAVRWVRDSIEPYGGDPARIVVVGHSAGAHTAALLALDARYLREAGVPDGSVDGFASLAGPVATVWTDPDVQALMGPREGWPETYPMELIDGTEPPLLLLQGGRDETVAPENAVRLGARIRDRGGCARVIGYKGLDHTGIVVALSLPRFEIAPVLEDVLAFARQPAVYACSRRRPTSHR